MVYMRSPRTSRPGRLGRSVSSSFSKVVNVSGISRSEPHCGQTTVAPAIVAAQDRPSVSLVGVQSANNVGGRALECDSGVAEELPLADSCGAGGRGVDGSPYPAFDAYRRGVLPPSAGGGPHHRQPISPSIWWRS